MNDGEVLAGGVANAGAIIRIGDEVRRPASAQTELVFSLLEHARSNGFTGVPEPLGIDEQGRERLRYIPGDVAIPPFPKWSLSPGLLASVSRLLRAFHDAVADFVPPANAVWNTELAHPDGGRIVGHNDVCRRPPTRPLSPSLVSRRRSAPWSRAQSASFPR
ncbi:hypothetical protein E4J89_10545 [Arthrobacter sp. CAU 1506]|uniref:hypothetical protein n=1 Tax=Arthrobacter sp. CAU 1506 TaxID=2560052 RepID=UPI0010AD746B|nr:hypothetical protein [Arthrobacter sp. CAU 1506]TJY69364.1 hypothetical protein E4J89_10545 [Arthrobacter sp. CAU 1506]